MSISPDIFSYLDYRKFISDWRKAEKERTPGLTHEYLCRKLGQKNRSYFSDVEKGRKIIGPEVLTRLIDLMNLKGDRAKYFRAMVGYGQPATYRDKEFWFERIIELNNTPKKLIDKDTYEYFDKWYHTSIRSLMDVINIKNDYKKIAEKMFNRITPEQAKSSIALLKRLNLIKENSKGFWKPTDKIVSTGNNVQAECMKKYHLSNNEVLRDILQKNEPGTHDSSIMTVSVSKTGLNRIIKRIQQLRKEIISISHKDEDRADRVYKIAVHAYPESRKE